MMRCSGRSTTCTRRSSKPAGTPGPHQFIAGLATDEERPPHVGAITVILWLDPDTGAQVWRCWCDVDAPVTTSLGLLELAKLDVIARSDTGLPISYND